MDNGMPKNKEEFNKPGKGWLNKPFSIFRGLWDKNTNWLSCEEGSEKDSLSPNP